MGGDIAVVAGQIVDSLAAVWPVVSGAAGGAAAKLLQRTGDKAADAASEAAVGWGRRVLRRVFPRRAAPDTPPDEEAADVEEVTGRELVDPEIAEALDELTANPENKWARQALARHLQDAAAADPALVETLHELAAQAPAPTTLIGQTGDITQAHTSGTNIAVTGTARDIKADGPDR